MSESQSLRGEKVLIVEDSRDIREILVLLIEGEGAAVTATGSGRRAVELVSEGDFDVVVTDLGLPDLPGETVIRHVVASARRRPLVVVTTAYDEPYLSRAREAGADVVLSKPFAWSELLEHLVVSAPLAA
jgi:CheY-like chemotaxis protein